jgi:signal transduction histidine kinase/Tfp pilus assembly protein PilF
MEKLLKPLTKNELELLKKLLENLIEMNNEDATNAIAQMTHLMANRSFHKHKKLFAELLGKLGEFYGRHKELEKAISYFEELVEYGRKQKSKKIENKALSNIAVCNAQMGRFMEAIETWKEQLSKSRDIEHKIHLQNNISAGYGYIGDGGLSLQHAFDALRKAEENNLEILKISPLINIGTALERDSLHQKALDYWLEAQNLARKYKQTQSLMNVLNNISLAYSALGNMDLALKYACECLELQKERGFPKDMAAPLNNIGYIYETSNDLDSALDYYEQALEMYRQSTDFAPMANCIANFGSVHIKKGEIEKAQEYLEEALRIVNSTDAQAIKIRVMNMLADVYAKRGFFDKAYEYMRKSSDGENEYNAKLKQNSIVINEANYYKRKIEAQAKAYRKQNIELKRKNSLILETTNDLEERNAMLNDTVEVLNWLVSVISHDVRAPLANFNRVLAMLLEGSFPEEEHTEILQSLKKSGENVFKLVDEMLDGIRLQRRKLDFSAELMQQDLVPILMSIFAIYLPIAMQHRIDLNYYFATEQIAAVIDADLFKIVIRNLLNNAIKFTPEQGKVDIRVENLDDMVQISVSDNGKGMDEKTLQALQSGMVPRTGIENLRDGIGLGLSLCRNALQRMNSGLKIESKPGKGTTISMSFLQSPKK